MTPQVEYISSRVAQAARTKVGGEWAGLDRRPGDLRRFPLGKVELYAYRYETLLHKVSEAEHCLLKVERCFLLDLSCHCPVHSFLST